MSKDPSEAIPPGWCLVRLGEVALVNPESLGSGTSLDLPFKYIDISSVEKGVIDWGNLSNQVYRSAPSRARRIVQKDDILFGTVRPALQSHGYVEDVHGIQVIASTGFTVLRALPEKVHSRYLFHVILRRDITAQACRAETGSSYPAVNEFDVARFQIALPSLPEQFCIAEVLDALSESIRTCELLIAKLRLVRKGLLCNLFAIGIDERGELRNAAEFPGQFKDSPLGRIPKKWCVRPLQEVTSAPICYGIVQPGPHSEEGIPVLTIRDLVGDFSRGLSKTARAIEKHYARSRVRGGDVVLSIKATIGRVAVVPTSFEGNISRDLARLRLSESVSASFLRYYFLSPEGQRRLALSVVGTTRAEISIGVLQKLRVPVPPPHEQQLITECLELVEHREQEECLALAKLQMIKDGLVDDLLSGSVRIIVAKEEPKLGN